MAETQKNEKKENFKYIIRIANSDIKGEKRVNIALRGIKGVSFAIANYICKTTKINPSGKAGNLSDADVEKITKTISNLSSAPEWLINRRNDPVTGESKHLISNDLIVVKDTELRELKKLKNYRGVRHMHSLPVRGQKTKSNFRRTKGKVLGVKRAKKGKKG